MPLSAATQINNNNDKLQLHQNLNNVKIERSQNMHRSLIFVNETNLAWLSITEDFQKLIEIQIGKTSSVMIIENETKHHNRLNKIGHK